MLGRLGKLVLVLIVAVLIVSVLGGVLGLAMNLLGVAIRVGLLVCMVVGALYLLGALRPTRTSRW